MRAWLITTLALRLRSRRTGFRFAIFIPSMSLCWRRETVSDTELVYDIAHFPSRAIPLSLAHSCEKNDDALLVLLCQGKIGEVAFPLPVVGN